MIRATTPTFILTLEEGSGVNLLEARKVFFTISQRSVAITKEVTPTSASTVEATLTQEEALQLVEGAPTKVQLNWTYASGSRAATLAESITVDEQLLKAVV